MIELSRLHQHRLAIFSLLLCLSYKNLNLCSSLNDEGFALLRFRDRMVNDPFGALANWNDEVGVIDPCLWFGVECSGGRVVVLNLRNLCLGGTIAPDIGNLAHLKSIILRNNSFSGTIPEKIGELKELEVLDLGYNNFSGPLPSDLGSNLSLKILLLDNNELFGSISPEVHELKLLSEAQVDEDQLSGQRLSCNRGSMSWRIGQTGDNSRRKLLVNTIQERDINNIPTFPSPEGPSSSLAPSPEGPSPSPAPSPAPNQTLAPPPSTNFDSPPLLRAPSPPQSPRSSSRLAVILPATIGGSALLLMLGIFFWRGNKVATVRPWATGLSGQLQKAFVTGVPKLKRSELESACEDFSNVISTLPIGTVYKGTLSSGVEIAVASVAVKCAKDWSKHLEAQYRKKIDTLSKVNHKNFVNLLGYCEEDEPFTRMIVFEYAPNGTLFEHLHVQEAEHLDWAVRMRIAMGMAYCLEHMHQLSPPIPHKNLTSSNVNLTEDYASKIADFGLWDESAAHEMESSLETNIYSFGVILFEMITGRMPWSVASNAIENWASDYLRGGKPLREMVDPTLKSFETEQLEAIGEVIRSCVHPEPKRRPRMRDISVRLREITGIGPDGAIPKISPLWWAELEILSTEAN